MSRPEHLAPPEIVGYYHLIKKLLNFRNNFLFDFNLLFSNYSSTMTKKQKNIPASNYHLSCTLIHITFCIYVERGIYFN